MSNKIRSLITLKGYSMRKVSKILKYDYKTLCCEINGTYKMSVYTAVAICRAIAESEEEARAIFVEIFFAHNGSKLETKAI